MSASALDCGLYGMVEHVLILSTAVSRFQGYSLQGMPSAVLLWPSCQVGFHVSFENWDFRYTTELKNNLADQTKGPSNPAVSKLLKL